MHIEVYGDVHLDVRSVVAHRLDGFEVLRIGWYGHEVIAEPHLRQLEGRPVEVRVELVGDGDILGRGEGVRIILKVNAVAQQSVRVEETLSPEAHRS